MPTVRVRDNPKEYHKPKSCSKCRKPALLHARCWKHFVKRFLERRGLLEKQWWRYHQEKFLAMLYGRYRTIVGGETPGDIEDFIYLIEHGQQKVWKGATTRPPARGTVQNQIRDMIYAIDEAAGREKRRGDKLKKQDDNDPDPDAGGRREDRGSTDGQRRVPQVVVWGKPLLGRGSRPRPIPRPQPEGRVEGAPDVVD